MDFRWSRFKNCVMCNLLTNLEVAVDIEAEAEVEVQDDVEVEAVEAEV